MKKIYLFLMVLVNTIFVLPVRANFLSDNLLFSAKMDGAQETPPVSTAAVGVASFSLNGTRDTMFINVSVAGLSGPITAAHIHEGAIGVAGPIIIPLTQWVSGNNIMGYLTGSDLSQANLAKFLTGKYYINVHTAANPNGEIRGQINLETDYGFATTLNGAQETPPVNTTAIGTGFFMLSHDKTKLKFIVVFEGLSGTPTAAHFHDGAVGIAGPIVSTLTSFISGKVIAGEVDPTTFLPQLLARNIYINIHTAANPNGEIRGQVLPVSGLNLGVAMDGTMETPPVTTNGKGVAGVRINATLDSIAVISQVTGLSGPITAAHFHIGAVGVPGPVIIPLTQFVSGNRIVGKVSLSGLPANIISSFLKGDMYMNVHTAANPNGEIRGQVYRLAREGYTFAMNGKQETPPVNTAGSGSGLVSIDVEQTNAHFMLVWSGLSGPATVAHFHKAIVGVPGPIIFPLTPFFNNTSNPTGAFGYWNAASTPAFTKQRAVEFDSDSMYANVHTVANPAGEIRGQVIKGAKNLVKLLSVSPDNYNTYSVVAYPNPSSQIFRIKLESVKNMEGTLRITDLLGRTILEAKQVLKPGLNEALIDLEKAPDGIYQLEFRSSESHMVSRLVKQ